MNPRCVRGYLDHYQKKCEKILWITYLDFLIYVTATGNEIIDQTKAELSRLPSKRTRIASVQMMLSELGYDTKNADGILGPKTRSAILRFQRKNGIRVDGKVNSQLVANLQNKRDALKAGRK